MTTSIDLTAAFPSTSSPAASALRRLAEQIQGLGARARFLRPPATDRRSASTASDTDATQTATLEAEIQALLESNPSALVASGGDLDVLLARATEIPNALGEIGRLREITFRAIGEGTGLDRDLDRHDADYRHLFLWDRVAKRIAGGYRLGLTDELLAKGGREALYTHSLFDYDGEFFARVGPGIELGRSFVIAEWQRSYLPLDLLWRGIGAFLARNPRYKTLFGPVSISAAYSLLSRELMIEHLQHRHFDDELARSVRPRTPPSRSGAGRFGLRDTEAMLADVADVSRLVAAVEPDAKGVPVLVREYLKLGGRFVGFNVDASFGNCLDGLVIVDVAGIPAKYRRRYLGE